MVIFSGQYVNNSKSSFFAMDNSSRFVTKIQCILLTDKVKLKLASWKGKSLSMMGRIQCVNTVTTGFLAYNFNLYKWHVSLLKQVKEWSQIFIWTSDIMKKRHNYR